MYVILLYKLHKYFWSELCTGGLYKKHWVYEDYIVAKMASLLSTMSRNVWIFILKRRNALEWSYFSRKSLKFMVKSSSIDIYFKEHSQKFYSQRLDEALTICLHNLLPFWAIQPSTMRIYGSFLSKIKMIRSFVNRTGSI